MGKRSPQNQAQEQTWEPQEDQEGPAAARPQDQERKLQTAEYTICADHSSEAVRGLERVARGALLPRDRALQRQGPEVTAASRRRAAREDTAARDHVLVLRQPHGIRRQPK